jgi:DNA-binding IclR family transcriptional regulator
LVRERVHFSIRQGTDVFTILSESPQRAIEAVGWVGRTSPLTCTASGRVLLFDHSDDEIRELFSHGFSTGGGVNAPRDVEDLILRVRDARLLGFAVVESEFDDDLTALAAPVRDIHGQIVGALNVSAPSFRLQTDRANVSRSLVGAATHLSSLLTSPLNVGATSSSNTKP